MLKLQCTITIGNDNDEQRVIHLKSYNIEIMIMEEAEKNFLNYSQNYCIINVIK